MAATHTIVYPKPGVTIYLPGGTHGFREGPVPVRAEHAAALAESVMTEAERDAAAKSRAAADERAADRRAMPAAAEP